MSSVVLLKNSQQEHPSWVPRIVKSWRPSWRSAKSFSCLSTTRWLCSLQIYMTLQVACKRRVLSRWESPNPPNPNSRVCCLVNNLKSPQERESSFCCSCLVNDVWFHQVFCETHSHNYLSVNVVHHLRTHRSASDRPHVILCLPSSLFHR